MVNQEQAQQYQADINLLYGASRRAQLQRSEHDRCEEAAQRLSQWLNSEVNNTQEMPNQSQSQTEESDENGGQS